MNRRSFLASAVAAALAPNALAQNPNVLCEASLEQALIDIKNATDASGLPIRIIPRSAVFSGEVEAVLRKAWEEIWNRAPAPEWHAIYGPQPTKISYEGDEIQVKRLSWDDMYSEDIRQQD